MPRICAGLSAGKGVGIGVGNCVGVDVTCPAACTLVTGFCTGGGKVTRWYVRKASTIHTANTTRKMTVEGFFKKDGLCTSFIPQYLHIFIEHVSCLSVCIVS